jgi:dTDP-glucose 4,6-dehydratase
MHLTLHTQLLKQIVRSYQETYGMNIVNIDGRNERTDLQILDLKVSKGNSYKDLIAFVEDRVGHDRRYAIDSTKLETEFGWRADENFESGIIKTVEWYFDK